MGLYVVRSPPSQHYIALIACPFLDHALELTLVNNALNADLCVPLLADQRKPTAAQKIAVLKPIIDIANNADNNLFLVTTAVENFVSWGNNVNVIETGMISQTL